MGQRSCQHCGRVCKSTSGLTRHLDSCEVLTRDLPRKRPRAPGSPPYRLRLSVEPTTQVHDVPEMTQDVMGVQMEQEPPYVDTNYDESYRETPHNQSSWELLQRDAAAHIEQEDLSNISTGTTRRGLLSTSSCCKVVTFSGHTRRPAGNAISPEVVDCKYLGYGNHLTSPGVDRGLYHPFDSEVDYALAFWFYQEKVTKGARDRFFRDHRLKSLHQFLKYQNSDDLINLEDRISQGLNIDGWKQRRFTIQPMISGASPVEYSIIYRNIITVLRFLLGHRAFREDMVFEPVRQYNSDDKRIYSEMHTGDWWWETQAKLPDGATVVPLLFATDKTALSRHQGDLSAWPVYLTIGNLKAHVRRAQKRPGLVLIGLLPIVPNDDGLIKSNVWHSSMSIISERTVYSQCMPAWFYTLIYQ